MGFVFENTVPNRYAQAPLAGYTDVGFRYLCAKYNCGLIVSEMVSAMSLCQKNKVAFDMLGLEAPPQSVSRHAVQLFGHRPDVFAEAVKYDEIQKFDVIDINMGCPVPKVVRNGEGSALMRNLPLASEIIRAAVKNANKPVTVKFRKGYAFNDNNAVEFAVMCEESGASAITVHGRTKEQMYGGSADMDIVAAVVDAVKIPVYANGDIKTADDAVAAFKKTGAFGAAIGRGAVGRPWIYEILNGGNGAHDLEADINAHYEIMLKHLPRKVVAGEMKKHVAAYLKGARGAKKVINKIFTSSDVDEQLDMIHGFLSLGEMADNS